MIDIELKKPNRLKDFFRKLHSRFEDTMYSIIMEIPEKYIPQFLMEWLDRYTTKRIQRLQQETTKQKWLNFQLERLETEISARQQGTEKAPPEGN